jgi:serine protease Do
MLRRRWWTVAVIAAIFLAGLTVGTRLTARGQGSGPALQAEAPNAAEQSATGDLPDHGRPVDTRLFRTVAKQQNPVVVFITTESKVRAETLPLLDDEFFRRFFGAPPTRPRDQVRRGLGSGFIVSGEGEILTNNHVVEGSDRIRVALFSDATKQYDARVIGRDPLTDTALVKLDKAPASLPTAALGDSDTLQPGDWVMAIGNPFNLGHTVTVGVVSYLGRPFQTSEGRYQKMIQTDASINPGNSGGPLIDTDGRVVGINAAILGGEVGGNIGIGFAVPINTAKTLLPQLRTGKIVRGRIGLQVSPIGDDEAQALKLAKPEGAIVRQVERESPAERAGIKPGDIIIECQGQPIRSADDLVALVSAITPGTRVPIVLLRAGNRQTVSVTVEELQGGVTASAQRSGAGFGLALADLTPDLAQRLGLRAGARGAVVEDIEPGSAAEAAGLRTNDVILEINHRPVRDAAEATGALRQARAAPVVFLLIARGWMQMFVSMRQL